MARIRSIKPEFWTDEAITGCSVSARLLFIGMWNFADDSGNLDRSAKQIKVRVFPTDRLDCEPLINELITHGLLIEYSVSDKKYLHIPGFIEHQVINRPSKPCVPVYEDSLRTHGVITDCSGSTHSGGEGKGSIGKGSGRTTRKTATGIPEAFTLTPEFAEYISKTIPDADPASLFEKFCDQARAKAWEYADWPRAFQTYCRNAAPGSGHFAAGQYPRRTQSHVSKVLPWGQTA